MWGPCVPGSRSVGSKVLPGTLHQLDFVTFRGIDESESGPVILHGRPVRIAESVLLKVLAKSLETFHFKGQMRQVSLDLNRAAGGALADFDQLLTSRSLEKHQLGTAR